MLGDLEKLQEKDAFREANELRGWIEVEKGGSSTTAAKVAVSSASRACGSGRPGWPFRPSPFRSSSPSRRSVTAGSFVQTAGRADGLPAPRRVRGKPYFQLASASAWTTLELIIHADGRSQGSLVGASPFPRHWVYDDRGSSRSRGRSTSRSGTASPTARTHPGAAKTHPPSSQRSSRSSSAELTESVMQLDAKLPRRRLAPGDTLVEQGAEGDNLFVLLDGVLASRGRRRDGRRGRAWCDPRRAGGRRGRAPHRNAAGGDALPADRTGVRPDQQVRADRARALALAGGGGLGLVVTAGTRCDNRRGGGKNGSRPPVLTAWCPPSGARTKGVRMEMTSRQAALVDIRDFSDGITATIPRAEFAAALTSEEPAELFLELTRPESDDKADVAVTWNRDELERLLAATAGPTVTLAFKRDELEPALDESDVEMHGFRDKALILSVAAAAAVGGASSAAAATHDEAGSTARGITPSYLAVHDEATLAARGIEAPVVASHDEATLAARGSRPRSRLRTTRRRSRPVGSNRRSWLRMTRRRSRPVGSSRRLWLRMTRRRWRPVGSSRRLRLRMTRRRWRPVGSSRRLRLRMTRRRWRPVGSARRSWPRTTRRRSRHAGSRRPVASAGDDGGISIEVPTIDATTAAVAGGLAGLGLLITAAGFATRRERGGGGPQPA